MYYNLDLTKEIPKAKLYLCKPDRTVIGKLNEAYGKRLKLKIKGINESRFNLPYKIEKNHKLIDNTHIQDIKYKYLIKIVYDDITEFHVIDNTIPTQDDNEYLQVKCLSIEEQLRKRDISYTKDAVKIETATNVVLTNVNWTLGSYPVAEVYRSFDISGKTILEALNEIADTFDTLLHFDTVNQTVNFYSKDYFANYKGFVATDRNYIQSFLRENENKEFCTRLFVYGKENLTFNRVNPTGQAYIDDFSYFLYPFQRDVDGNVLSRSDYMSDDLCHAILDYNELAETKSGEFDTLLSQKDTLQTELTTLQNDLSTLQTELKSIEDQIFVNEKLGVSTTTLETDKANKESEIAAKETEITNKEAEIDSVNTQIDTLRSTLDMSNNFTVAQLEELDHYIIEDTWKNENISDDGELYTEALSKMQEKKVPNFNLRLNIANFKSMITEQKNWDKLSLGSTIRTKKESMGIDTKSQVIEIDFSFDDEDINLSLSNSVDYMDFEKEIITKLYLTERKTEILDNKKFEWDSAESNMTAYIDDQISQVNDSITNLDKGFQKYAADGFLSKDEALQLKQLKEQMNAESSDLVSVATALSITTEKDNYQTALTTLDTELTGVIGATSYPITVLTTKRTSIQNAFNDVQDKKSILVNKISEIRDANLDAKLSQDITDVNTSVNNVKSELDEAISDAVITENEANSLKTSLESLQSESTDIISMATKFGIITEKTDYETALSDLETELTTNWIDQDPSLYPIAITSTERDLVRLKFSDVQNKKSLLLNAIAQARDIEISGWGITSGGLISVQNKVDNIVTHATVPSDQISASGTYLTSINVGDTSSLPSSADFGTYYMGYWDSTRVWDQSDSTEKNIDPSVVSLKWTSKDATTLYGVEMYYKVWILEYFLYPCEIYNGMKLYEYHQPTGDVVVSPMSVVTPDNKKLEIPQTTFSNHTLAVGAADTDGWMYKYLYLDTNETIQIVNAGTSGGINDYPPSPPAGSVAIGYMLTGYGVQKPDGELTTDKDIQTTTGYPNFKDVIYHDIRYRDERVVKVDGNELTVAEAPYGKSIETINCGTQQYQTVIIPIGKGKRSINVSITLDDGTDYDNYEYGATLTVGRKSANNADGLGSPVWAVYTDASGNRGHVQQHRNTAPYGVHILQPQVWNKSYTLLYDADIEPDSTNPDTLNLKLVFYNYSSSATDGSFDLKINWHAL